jgi:cell division protein FtsL
VNVEELIQEGGQAMSIIFVICALAIVFAYEIRHRMLNEQINYLNTETQRLDQEVKKLKEDLVKKQDIEVKKSFKFPFLPEFK